MKWPLASLKLLSTLGPQYGANAPAVVRSGKRPRYVRITDISSDGRLRPDGAVEADLVDESEFALEEGDLLFARSGNTVGKTYCYSRADGPCVFAGYMIRFRLNRALVEPRFAFFFTQSEPYQRWLDSKRRVAGQPNVNGAEYSSLVLPVPAPREQRRIVELLEQADALRHQRTEADTLAARILPALFRKMFGEPVANPFKWPIAKGAQIFGNVRYGVGTPPPFAPSGIPFLRAGNIDHGRFVPKNLVYFDEADAHSIERSRVKAGEVIIVRRGAYTGDCAVVPSEFDGAFVGYDLICTANSTTEPEWFTAAFLYPTVWQQIETLRSRAAQQGLNKQQIEEFALPYPPKKLQEQFAQRVRDARRIEAEAEGSRATLNTLFQTMLHRAFTGELTARWRAAHLKELLAEMEQQSRDLRGQPA